MPHMIKFSGDHWCMVHLRPNSDVVQVAGNIENEDCAKAFADLNRQRGGYVFCVCTAGELVAALELLRSRKG